MRDGGRRGRNRDGEIMSEVSLTIGIIEGIVELWKLFAAGHNLRTNASARALGWLLHEDRDTRVAFLAELSGNPELLAQFAQVANASQLLSLREIAAEASK
jgi:hypothetical protein